MARAAAAPALTLPQTFGLRAALPGDVRLMNAVAVVIFAAVVLAMAAAALDAKG